MNVIKAIKTAPTMEMAKALLSNADLEGIAKKLNIFYPAGMSRTALSSIIVHICRK